MRAIVILILVILAVGMVRMLLGDVMKAVSKSMSSEPAPEDPPANPKGGSAGRLVKDPETGAYIDESSAIPAEINGKIYFFESTASRDAYLRKNRS